MIVFSRRGDVGLNHDDGRFNVIVVQYRIGRPWHSSTVALFKGFIATQRTNRRAAWDAAPAKANRCGTLPGEGACAILAVRNMAQVSGGDDAPAACHVAHMSSSRRGAALGGATWSTWRRGPAGR